MSPYDAIYFAIGKLKEARQGIWNEGDHRWAESFDQVIKDAEAALNELIDRRSSGKISKST